MARTRTWDGHALRQAVAGATSWKAVCEALGIPVGGKTVRALRAEAVALGLDTSALYGGGQRGALVENLTDDALRHAVAQARSWNDLSRRLGYASNVRGEVLTRLLARIDALSLSTEHFRGKGLNGYRDIMASHEHPFTREVQPEHFRRAATGVAIRWFSERGYAVSLPVEPVAYDLVVEVDGRFSRVQVKSSTASNRCVQFSRNSYDAERGQVRAPYAAGDLDYFFVALSDGSLYLMPQDIIGDRMQAVLGARYEAFRL